MTSKSDVNYNTEDTIIHLVHFIINNVIHKHADFNSLCNCINVTKEL